MGGWMGRLGFIEAAMFHLDTPSTRQMVLGDKVCILRVTASELCGVRTLVDFVAYIMADHAQLQDSYKGDLCTQHSSQKKFIFHIEPFGSSSTISHLFHIHNAAHTVSLLHLLKGSVDGRQRLPVGDELVHLELAVEVVVHQTGQLRATLDATEGAALPDTAGNQLECFEWKSAMEHLRERKRTYAEWRSLDRQQQHQ